MREVSGQFEKPALMFSTGKEFYYAGIVHLALKAFTPPNTPFSLVHTDTGNNFPEALVFRDDLAEKNGAELIYCKKGRGQPFWRKNQLNWAELDIWNCISQENIVLSFYPLFNLWSQFTVPVSV